MSKGLNLIFFFGRPLSPFYSALMKVREKLYRAGVFRQHCLSVPVLSLGNLVLGGTGKTPMVRHVADLLLRHGYRPAIVSRGYGGKTKEAVTIVSDGKTVLSSPALAGDESCLLAQSLPGVPVLTGRRRFAPCLVAIDQFQVDIIILDDGFQHLPVKRNLDIVLFDGSALAGNSRVFPAGPLREPVSALKRCQAFLLTGKNSENSVRVDKFADLLQQRFPDRPIFTSSINAVLFGPEGTPAQNYMSQKFFGFCGIANPSRFEKSLTGLGVDLVSMQPLKDHAPYNQTLVSNICKKAIACGAESLVTTEKDFVKLSGFDLQLPLYILKIHHDVEQDFDRFLLNSLKE